MLRRGTTTFVVKIDDQHPSRKLADGLAISRHVTDLGFKQYFLSGISRTPGSRRGAF